MAKHINLQDKQNYKAELKSTLNLIADFKTDLFSKMINLATLDKWKEWSDKKAEGSIQSFDERSLRDTGDKNIDLIFKLYDQIEALEEELTTGKKG